MSWCDRVGLGLLFFMVGCGGTGLGASGDGGGYETVARPTTAEELDVQLDSEGRPLAGSSSGLDLTHEFESLGNVAVPDGELLLMDGIAIWIGPGPDDGIPVKLPVEEMELLALRTSDEDGHSYASNHMVLLRVPNAEPISHWGDLNFAYVTDGGLGGFTGPLVVERAVRERARDAVSEYFVDLDLVSDQYLLDLDDLPGNDTFVFSNGWGDGGFPYALGYSDADEVVALVIWSMVYPWRVVFPESEPPPAIIRREDDLLACMEGTRPIEISTSGYMHCPSDSW